MSTCDCQYKYKSAEFEYPKVDFTCNEKARTGSTLCVFHDENYVKEHYVEFEREAAKRFEEKVRESSTENKPLECIGYYLPAIEFAKYFPTTALTEKGFSQPVYFNKATFYEANFFGATFSNKADFFGATFSNKADFRTATFSNEASFFGATFSNEASFFGATFSNEANFSGATFSSNESETFFDQIIFEQPNKVLFEKNNLSKVSFAGSDITRIRFGDKVSWGEKGFTIVEEEWLRKQAKGKEVGKKEQVSLELVSSVYRNLRENYEFRLRYNDAGKFFIKEMELKRKYREAPAKSPLKAKLHSWYKKLKGDNNSPIPNIEYVLIENGRLRRNLSLTGLYYHFSTYGESIAKPAIIGAITVGISTLFWMFQNSPTDEPFLPFITAHQLHDHKIVSNFINITQVLNNTHSLKAFERSFSDLIPLLPQGSNIKVGIIDYIIKIVGGALTFGLLAIALRRKFERKYTR